MTDKQMAALVRSMWADLRKTEKGYRDGKDGRNWKNAERKREQILTALERVPVPALGPVLEDGPSMLTYAPTHNTDGVPLHPAFDAGFGQAGRGVLAPELLTIQRQSSAQGGEAVYALGRSGIHYWIGHIGVAPATGRTFKKGERIARIADQSGTDHVHWGVDVRALTGRSLLYGRTGSGPDYTWGSPTIGQQLASVLEA
jgi:hypothetical protein